MKKTNKIVKKYKFAIVIVVLLSALAVTGVKATDGGFFDRIAQIAGEVLGNSLSDKMVDIEQVVGAMPGNELQGPEFTVSGLTRSFYSNGMNKASTTLCVITPSQRGFATSTIEDFFLSISVGTSTASTIVVATSTDAYSTSSEPFIGPFTVAASAQLYASWRPAVDESILTSAASGYTLIQPTDYILVKTAGASLANGTGYSYTGKCAASFTQLK